MEPSSNKSSCFPYVLKSRDLFYCKSCLNQANTSHCSSGCFSADVSKQNSLTAFLPKPHRLGFCWYSGLAVYQLEAACCLPALLTVSLHPTRLWGQNKSARSATSLSWQWTEPSCTREWAVALIINPKLRWITIRGEMEWHYLDLYLDLNLKWAWPNLDQLLLLQFLFVPVQNIFYQASETT